MTAKALGWQITVALPDGSPPRIYNVAIAEEARAVEAVKRTLGNAKDVVVKVKSELTERVYKALRPPAGRRDGRLSPGGRRGGAGVAVSVDLATH